MAGITLLRGLSWVRGRRTSRVGESFLGYDPGEAGRLEPTGGVLPAWWMEFRQLAMQDRRQEDAVVRDYDRQHLMLDLESSVVVEMAIASAIFATLDPGGRQAFHVIPPRGSRTLVFFYTRAVRSHHHGALAQILRVACAIALLAVAVLSLTPPGYASFQEPTDGVVVRQSPVPELQPLPPGPGSLSGRAIERETNTPLPDARVVVRLLGERVGDTSFASTPFGRVLTSDKGGAFAVPNIPYGHYVVEVTMAGYADGTAFIAGGSRRTMRVIETQPSPAETFTLSRLGTLGGIVVNEKGEPQSDHAVMLFRRRTESGSPALPELARAVTDREGRYRFTSVPPAQYIAGVDFRSTTMPVSVSEAYRRAVSTAEGERMDARLAESRAPVPRPLFPGLSLTLGRFQLATEDGARRLRPIEMSDGRIMAVASTYAPGVTSFAGAEVYPLAAGQHLTGVNITIRRHATVRVSGTLTGPEGTTGHVGLRLVPNGADGIDRASFGDAAVTVTDATGEFTFLGVVPGQYSLEGAVLVHPAGTPRTMRPELQRWAKTPVEVSTENIDGLSVSLNEPLFVTGRAVFVTAGSDAPPRPVQAGIRVYLHRRSGQQASYPWTSTLADGTFSLGPAFPSHYQLAVEAGAPWRVLSIVANGRDVTDTIIDLDRHLTDVVITMTNAGR